MRSWRSSPAESTSSRSSASAGDRGGDHAAAADLRVVAHPLQQPVGDPRRASRALGDHVLAAGLDLDLEDARGAANDLRQVGGVVVLEPLGDAEAVAQRRRQQPGPGRRADERERRQVERDRPRAGALAEHDRQLAVLHRRVQRLLDRPVEAVDLVDEEHRPGLERGEEGGDVGLALQRRAGRLHERRLELGGDDVGERGLAEPRGPGEQHVVERLLAPARRLDEHLELAGHLNLVDEVGEAPRAQRAVELLVGAGEPGLGHRLGPGSDPAADARVAGDAHEPLPVPALRRAAPISSSGVSPLACSSSLSASTAV